MNDLNENIVWTIIWMIFILILCVLFDSASPLGLFIIWLLGLER